MRLDETTIIELADAVQERPWVLAAHGRPQAVVISAQQYADLMADARLQHFTDTTEELARVVKRHRAAMELSLETLAHRIGTGTRFVWDVEHGVSRPEFDKVVQLANALGIAPTAMPSRALGPWMDSLEPIESNLLPEETP